ncbi:MAG: tetratricopeptide repeat protein [bacterium]|nr:tetratricopeptide repeat protein [bacterium]
MLIFSVIGPSAASLPAGRFRPAGRNPSARRRPVRPTLAGLVLALAVCALHAAAGSTAAGYSGNAAERPDARYYLRLKNEEFLRLMIPKEKALLAKTRNIFEEAKARRDQGRDLSALDLESVTSSRQLFLDAYAGEVGRVLSLFDEIAKLESTARRRANLSALEILAGLRRKVRDILERAASGSAAVTATASGRPGAEPEPGKAPPEPDAASAVSETAPQSAGSETANPEMAETLLDQWKYNSLLEFKLRQTRTELIRTKLLKTATQEEADRMFRRDLREALQAYAAGDFVLSRLLLRDVIETYPGVPVMDDVLYYAAESSFALNYLDEALRTGERLAGRYPLSPYTAKALVKKLFIQYATGRVDSLQETYDRLLAVRNRLEDEPFGVASYVAGLAAFNRGAFGDALSALARVPAGTAYAYPARYLSAACHSNLNNDDSAMAVYYRLASGPSSPERDPVLRRIRNNARLKLGLIYYERGENRRAITLFNQVDDDFQKDDLTLLARAWSAYRSGRPVEALANTETLLTQTLFSGYQYEAQVLAARSKELLGQSDEALRDMERVRRVRLQPAAPLPAASADSAENARNRTLFAEANRISRFLSEVPAGPADDPAPGGGDSRLDAATDALGRKIGVLDSLEARARDRRNWMTLDRIRKLRGGAIQALQTRNRKSADRLGDQDPLIRRMGMSVYLRYLFDTLLSDVLEEKRVTAEAIAGIDRLSVRSGDPVSIRVRMEIRRDELEDYGLRLNQYEVWLRENRPQPFAVEIDRWANFSEYGISNINFNRIREIDGRMTEISSMIRQIDEVQRAKREELSRRVAALLRDVEQIERQMKADLRKKDEQERDRFFQTDYFDTRRRETPVDAPVPERPRFEAEVLP